MDIASIARLLLLAAIWGASFLFMRIAAPVFGTGMLAELRVAIAALSCGWYAAGSAARCTCGAIGAIIS